MTKDHFTKELFYCWNWHDMNLSRLSLQTWLVIHQRCRAHLKEEKVNYMLSTIQMWFTFQMSDQPVRWTVYRQAPNRKHLRKKAINRPKFLFRLSGAPFAPPAYVVGMLTHSPKSYGVWAREGKKRQELTPHEILVDTIAETFNISCVDKELTEKVWKCDSVEVKCNTCLQWLDNRSSVSNDNVGPILRQKDKSNTDLYKLRFLWCLAIYSSQQAIYRLFFDNLKQSCLDFGLWMVKDTHLISMTSLSLPIFLESDSKRSKESFAEGKRYEVTITLVNRLVYYIRGVLCACTLEAPRSSQSCAFASFMPPPICRPPGEEGFHKYLRRLRCVQAYRAKRTKLLLLHHRFLIPVLWHDHRLDCVLYTGLRSMMVIH